MSACIFTKKNCRFIFCRLFYPTELILTQHDSTLLNWCLKTLKIVKKSNKETFPYFRQCMFTNMHCRFIFWLSIILSYQNGFNLAWLNITELMHKNIENCKKNQINVSIFSWVHVYENTLLIDLLITDYFILPKWF